MIGGICWFCHWGWPKPIRDVYDRACSDIDAVLTDEAAQAFPEPSCGSSALEFGPAHIVWSDENFTELDFCLTNCSSPQFRDWYPPTLNIIRRSLTELDAIPHEIREPPDGYEGENPENFPPPPGVIMVKK